MLSLLQMGTKNLGRLLGILLFLAYLTGCVSPSFVPPTDLPLPAPRHSQDYPISNYTVYYGPLTPEAREKLRYFQLVILHPNNSLELDHDTLRGYYQEIRKGLDGKIGTDDDVKILGYVSVGEDPRAFKYFDLVQGEYRLDLEALKNDQVFYNPQDLVPHFSGPRVDPRGILPKGGNLEAIDPLGLPSPGGSGFLRYYLDDADRVHNPTGADGIPDHNPYWGSLYVNVGDPLWFDELNSMTREAEGYYGLGEMLSPSSLGLDGLFLDTVDTMSPNYYSGPGSRPALAYEWTAPGYVDFLVRLRDLYPDTYLVQNRGLFFFDPQIPHSRIPVGPRIDGVVFENFRLDSDPDRPFNESTFNQHSKEIIPDLAAFAQVHNFQVFSLGYTHPNTSEKDVQEEIRLTQEWGLVPALTNPMVTDLHFAAYIARELPDIDAPRWSNTGYVNVDPWPRTYRQPLFSRAGIREARWIDSQPGTLEIIFDPALDRSPLTYFLVTTRSNSSESRRFDLDLELNPRWFDPGSRAPAFRSTVVGLDPDSSWRLELLVRDTWGNETGSRSRWLGE